MILKGKKVILRPVKIKDAPRYVKWFNNPAVNKFLSRRKLTLKEEKKWIKNQKKSKQDKTFAIETFKGEHIGSTSITISEWNKCGRFGIMIGDRRYWNRGFGSDAINTMLDYGFKALRLNRIQLEVFSYNRRAFAVYKKAGFKKEGVQRKHCLHKGRYYDTFFMGILRNEWKEKG